MARVRRGEIYFADLGPVAVLPTGEGAIEIAKRRPVLIVSTDALNRVSERKPFYVLVVPGTTGESSHRDFPTNVRLLPHDTGLPYETVFVAHQMRSIDVRRISGATAGRLRGSSMARVERAMRHVLLLE